MRAPPVARAALLSLCLTACDGGGISVRVDETPQDITAANRQTAKRHIEIGMDLAARGLVTEAIGAYGRAAASAPDLAAVHYHLGNAHLQLLDYPQAVDSFLRALALDSTLVSARHNLAATYLRQQRYLEAIAEHERVLAMDPGHLTSYYNLTTTFLEQGEFERAQELIDRGREIAPNDAFFERMLGRLRLEQQRYGEALTALERAVVLDNTHAGAFADLAKVRLRLHQPAEAISACQRGLQLDGRLKRAWYSLGEAYRRLGREAESREALQQFERLNREDEQLKRQLMAVGNQAGDYTARATLATLYAQQGRFEEALAEYRIAARMMPDSTAYRRQQGVMHMRLGQYEQALVVLTSLIGLDAADADLFYSLGLASLHREKFAQAKTFLIEARRLQTDHSDVNFYLGLLFARDGNFDLAAGAFEAALEARPDFVEARKKLAIAYFKQGRLEESKREVRLVEKMEGARQVPVTAPGGVGHIDSAELAGSERKR